MRRPEEAGAVNRKVNAPIPAADIRFVDSGHFALETYAAEIGSAMSEFLADHIG